MEDDAVQLNTDVAMLMINLWAKPYHGLAGIELVWQVAISDRRAGVAP